ncbi:hypothetical protein LOD99_2955 [Oopsacas minuta]|uniref:PDZ domain-containing protein n=1 Tax=Oopsacas minuta TaxID=111878 RepID=A0AAV7K0J8_9METZ|nr:hypothetical protein LOD99_2955 [Oopsacas minuta]
MDWERHPKFYGKTAAGEYETKRIHHNPIRREDENEIVLLEPVTIESQIADFRFPIINLKLGNKEDVNQCNYGKSDFENEVTRSTVYRHDELIRRKAGVIFQTEIVKNVPKIGLVELKQVPHKVEAESIKDRDLVVVRKDVVKGQNTNEVPTQSNTAIHTKNNNDTITIDSKIQVSENQFDIKGEMNSPNKLLKRERVIVKKPPAKIVKKETDTITRTERIRYKTRKTQPLVAKDTVKTHNKIIRKSKMEVFNQETLAVEGIPAEDDENKTPDEALSLARTDMIGIKSEMVKNEIVIDRKQDEIQVADMITDTAIAPEVQKEMEVFKTYGQKEFGFHLYGRKNFEGHYISRIEGGSGAERAGLRVGDRLIRIDGKSADDLKHTDMVELIKNSSATLNVVVRNEIHILRKLKLSVENDVDSTEIAEKILDFSDMDKARPKRKQAPKSQNWKEKKRMFQNL